MGKYNNTKQSRGSRRPDKYYVHIERHMSGHLNVLQIKKQSLIKSSTNNYSTTKNTETDSKDLRIFRTLY